MTFSPLHFLVIQYQSMDMPVDEKETELENTAVETAETDAVCDGDDFDKWDTGVETMVLNGESPDQNADLIPPALNVHLPSTTGSDGYDEVYEPSF